MAAMGGKSPHYEHDAPLATSEELENFYEHLEKVLIDVKFLVPENPRNLMRRLRRMYIRAQVDKNEVNILRGMLSAIDKKKLDKQ